MKLKICGLKYRENIEEISQYHPDFMGFIFYPKSKRFVGENWDPANISNLPNQTKKVGVFVNESQEKILETVKTFHLDFVQLHGDEEPDFCHALKNNGLSLIKAFQMNVGFKFENLKAYLPFVEYFLFDTQTAGYGGSGLSFDWDILQKYELEKPFLLSGGIGPDNMDAALAFRHKQLAGFDLNSKLEISPGLKSPEMVKSVLNKFFKSNESST